MCARTVILSVDARTASVGCSTVHKVMKTNAMGMGHGNASQE